MDDEGWRLSAKADSLKLRAAVIRAIRRFFHDRDFLEIETPLRMPAPAPESHIDAVGSDGWYLQTSPELCMKQLLAAGYQDIFQICRCFRAGERGARHLPEFTMLEWYRAEADYLMLMEDCEALISFVAGEVGLGSLLSWQGRRIDLTPPWERITVREAFVRYASLSVDEALRKNRFDETMVCAVEPRLGCEHPVFLYEYPAALGALARVKQDDPSLAERFELYIGSLELANAFSELTDAAEQRRRFDAAGFDRSRCNRPVYPMPERFLAALPLMPPAAGIALGVDRLAMLIADRSEIDAVVAFPPELL
jgi:elongation factor P--(R)-beta-lysine ligase